MANRELIAAIILAGLLARNTAENPDNSRLMQSAMPTS